MEISNLSGEALSIDLLMQPEVLEPICDADVREEYMLANLDVAVDKGLCSREDAERFLYEARTAGTLAVRQAQNV